MSKRTTSRPSTGQRSPDDDQVLGRFEANRPMAARLANRYAHRSNHDDLGQVADLALLMASRRYDPEQGAFERFAVTTIIGELKKFLRSTGWAVRVPRQLQEDALAVAAAVDQLTITLGRSPLMSEVGATCGLTAERVSEALRAGSARFAAPHDIDYHHDEDETDRATLTIAVDDAVSQLDDDARTVVELIFVQGCSQREAGARLHISQSQIQRRLTKALHQLEQPLSDLADHRLGWPASPSSPQGPNSGHAADVTTSSP